MELQKMPLPLRESANVHDAAVSMPMRWSDGVRDRGDDELAGILKADEAPVEQVVDARASTAARSRRRARSSFDASRQGLQWLATR